MSLSRKRNRQRATFIGAIIGVIVILTSLISLLNPNPKSGSSSSAPTTVNYLGTLTPAPTPVIFPTPESNPQLEGLPPYIHSSGYFQTFRPAGTDWIVSEGESVNASSIAKVVIQSPQRLVVIHNYIQPGVEYESLQSFSTSYLTPQHFAGAWSEYASWKETGRTITGDSVIVDFDLVAEGKRYLSRSTYRLDGSWLFVVRLVVPSNNPALLDLLQKLVVPSFVGYHDLLPLPQAWPAYIDQQLGFVLKHPAEWELVAGDRGRAVTFNIPAKQGKNTVRAWAVSQQPLGSTQEAEDWLKKDEPAVSIVGSGTLKHEMGSGYQVAYSYLDEQGDTHSGLAVLLNDAGGTLYVCLLQIDPPDLNLVSAQNLSSPYSEALQAVTGGFIVLPDSARQPITASQETQITPTPTSSAP